MIQRGFFDLDNRYEKLDKLGDPLPKIESFVDWEGFRPILETIRVKPRKSNAGRPSFDVVLMFKTLVLQSLYNLSDDQVEFQIRDRYSFCRFLGLTPEGLVPDAKTVWVFREELKQHDLIDKLFYALDSQIESAGYLPRKGQIIDASIVEVPRQRNSRNENEQIKSGLTPDNWSEPKLRQKDVDGRWTKKHGKSYYGYKNHISIDREHKLIRHWSPTTASVHDSQVFEELLDENNTSCDVWADSAYWSGDREVELEESGYRSHIHRKGVRGKALDDRSLEANRKRSSVRVRVEHVFGQQASFGTFIRTIGFARSKLKIGMMNIVYNLKRMTWLVKHVKPKHRLAVS